MDRIVMTGLLLIASAAPVGASGRVSQDASQTSAGGGAQTAASGGGSRTAPGGSSVPLTSATAPAEQSPPEMQPTLISSPAAWFGPDNYPPDAMRAKRQGRVVAAIKVDARGVATSCSIAISSGTTSLDETTCHNALAHAAFDPARDREGKAIDGVYRLSVRWVLPEDHLSVVDVSKHDPEDTLVDYEVKIDADGRAVSCTPIAVRMITQTGVPCDRFLPGSQTNYRWRRNGHPVGARLVFHSTLHVVTDR